MAEQIYTLDDLVSQQMDTNNFLEENLVPLHQKFSDFYNTVKENSEKAELDRLETQKENRRVGAAAIRATRADGAAGSGSGGSSGVGTGAKIAGTLIGAGVGFAGFITAIGGAAALMQNMNVSTGSVESYVGAVGRGLSAFDSNSLAIIATLSAGAFGAITLGAYANDLTSPDRFIGAGAIQKSIGALVGAGGFIGAMTAAGLGMAGFVSAMGLADGSDFNNLGSRVASVGRALNAFDPSSFNGIIELTKNAGEFAKVGAGAGAVFSLLRGGFKGLEVGALAGAAVGLVGFSAAMAALGLGFAGFLEAMSLASEVNLGPLEENLNMVREAINVYKEFESLGSIGNFLTEQQMIDLDLFALSSSGVPAIPMGSSNTVGGGYLEQRQKLFSKFAFSEMLESLKELETFDPVKVASLTSNLYSISNTIPMAMKDISDKLKDVDGDQFKKFNQLADGLKALGTIPGVQLSVLPNTNLTSRVGDLTAEGLVTGQQGQGVTAVDASTNNSGNTQVNNYGDQRSPSPTPERRNGSLWPIGD